MRKLIPTLLASALFGVCALTAAGTAVAADPATGTMASHADRRAEFQQRFFDKIDTNHDGVISRAEYQAWIDSRFAKLDTKGTGSIDANDIVNSPAARQQAQKRAERFIKRYDTSGTGSVSKADFEAGQMDRFDRLSGGADTLTPEQFAAAGRAFGKHRGKRGNAAGATPDGDNQ